MFSALLFLEQAGKLRSCKKLASKLAASREQPRLLRYYDTTNLQSFLIDTGAAHSVVPPRQEDMKNKNVTSVLRAANGTTIDTYGERYLAIDLGMGKNFPWIFVVADVNESIIGADFLAIAVNFRDKKIIDQSENLKSRAKITLESYCHEIVEPHNEVYTQIINEFPDLLAKIPKLTEIKHNAKLYIRTNSPPIYTRPRRMGPVARQAAEKEFLQMLQDGIIRPSDSPWASPLHIVPKKSGDWRPVGDYRGLNRVTQRGSYPLPHIHDSTMKLHGKSIFSKIDLRSAYTQIPVSEQDISKTAVTTPFGSFEYLRMPYGLCGASQVFQRFLDTALRGLKVIAEDGRERPVNIFNYVDDILISSNSETEHKEDLRALLRRLSDNSLQINPLKCEFGKKKLFSESSNHPRRHIPTRRESKGNTRV